MAQKIIPEQKTVCGDFWFLPDHLVSMVFTGSQGDHIYSVNIKRDTGKHVTLFDQSRNMIMKQFERCNFKV